MIFLAFDVEVKDNLQSSSGLQRGAYSHLVVQRQYESRCAGGVKRPTPSGGKVGPAVEGSVGEENGVWKREPQVCGEEVRDDRAV